MREIKFRGRNIEGEWFYGDLINCKINNTPTAFIFPPDAPNSYDRYLVNPNTVGQFTGLHDKNGKEIYEGDIISHKYTNGPQCCFSEGKEEINYIGFRRSECKFIVVCANRHHDLYEPYNIHIEVIGNIFDNPELIKSL